MVYTKASLPDNHDVAKVLLTTSLYHRYLLEVFTRRVAEPHPADILAFSSSILVDLFRQVRGDDLPSWCAPVSIKDYSDRKYDKIRADLRKLYHDRYDLGKCVEMRSYCACHQLSRSAFAKRYPTT
jgi:hypothetical protein